MPIQYTISGSRITFPAQTYTNASGQQITIPETIAIYRYVSGDQIALATELNTIIDLFNRLPPSAALNMRSQRFVEFHFNRYANYPGAAGSWNVARWMDVHLVDESGVSATKARNQRLLTIAHELGDMYFGDARAVMGARGCPRSTLLLFCPEAAR